MPTIRIHVLVILGILPLASGCHLTRHQKGIAARAQKVAIEPANTPRELCKTTLPTYRIEPPDILDIEAVRIVPRSDYRLNTTDVLRIQVKRAEFRRLAPGDTVTIRVPAAPALAPIDDLFLIQPDGTVSLGANYGSVKIAGDTLEQAEERIETKLDEILKLPETYVALSQAGVPVDGEFSIELDGTVDFGAPYGAVALDGLTITKARQMLNEHFKQFFEAPAITINLLQASILQQIVGEHMVGPDGSITLGIYGSVPVAGLTVAEVSELVEAQLAIYLDEPQVATSVLSYNSKVFYIIANGGGLGDGVYRFPVTGNETVLDALSLIQGLPQGSSYRMWVARPTPEKGQYVTMPIDWADLTSLAATETNYQLLPGDRLYIDHDPMMAFDNGIAKLTAPLERIMGFSILGAETATRMSGKVLSGGGNPRTNF
ncbi:polysaccharide biosynthesis/export family protein [Crateriforma conspicua]|uniref:Polysaccharide biosynthesis/export protein n=1 Tax=Crateriforma conspicua TaxID=2527996 RepID=A0A5C5Y6G5_9PLAN|nr:polysaccharide biosynthesis/export family protein [Crateriforma conspicua]QDV65145.1 Polysaccharide biosynthesis/export protein [Crateriforma conspicua]TWT70539.1 Polysaccharide biosynthesis/export protein [Crateriforma conspicua]